MSEIPHAEIEAKFRLGRKLDAQKDLDAALADLGLTAGPARETRHTDLYLDTADWFFWTAGVACRVRSTPKGDQLCFKAIRPVRAGVAERAEWEKALSEPVEDTRRLPGEGFTAFREGLGDRPLRVVATVEQTRIKRVAEDEDGLKVEVSLDDVRYARPGRKKDRRESVVELELMEGHADRMRALATRLAKRKRWTSETQSKLERALELAEREPPSAPTRRKTRARDRDSILGTVRRVVRKQLAHMLWNEPGTRVGVDAEYLHDMRVAIRRMMAAIDLFGRGIEKPRRKALRGRLKRMARVLGRVRDLDVFIGNLPRYSAGLGADAEDGVTVLTAHLHAERGAARAAMLEFLDGEEYAETVAALDRFGRSNRRAQRRFGLRRTGSVAPALLMARVEAVLEQGRGIVPASSAETYHDLRRTCRRLRYAGEFLANIESEVVPTLVEHQVALQDLLGAHQDADVAGHLLEDFVRATPTLDAKARRGLSAVRDAQFSVAESCRDRFPDIWARFDDRALLASLEDAMR